MSAAAPIVSGTSPLGLSCVQLPRETLIAVQPPPLHDADVLLVADLGRLAHSDRRAQEREPVHHFGIAPDALHRFSFAQLDDGADL